MLYLLSPDHQNIDLRFKMITQEISGGGWYFGLRGQNKIRRPMTSGAPSQGTPKIKNSTDLVHFLGGMTANSLSQKYKKDENLRFRGLC